MLSQVPAFMDPSSADDFATTPEFWPLVDDQVFKRVQMGVVEHRVSVI